MCDCGKCLDCLDRAVAEMNRATDRYNAANEKLRPVLEEIIALRARDVLTGAADEATQTGRVTVHSGAFRLIKGTA